MRKVFTPGRLLLAGALLALVTFGVLWLAPSDDYLLLPDEAHPVAPLVTVETPKRGGGQDGIYFVDLIQKRASLLESIFPSVRDGSTLVPQSRVNPHGIAESVRRQADLGQMARSQEIAAAVALRELGYDVQIRENGAFVASVYSDLPAFGKVLPGRGDRRSQRQPRSLDPRPARADRGEQAGDAAHVDVASRRRAAEGPSRDRRQPGGPQTVGDRRAGGARCRHPAAD